MKHRISLTTGLVIASLFIASWAGAAVCVVPSPSFSTIQSAVNDSSCTEIDLAAQSFAESVTIDRSLTMRGASSGSTVIEGQAVVEGSSTIVVMEDLTVDGAAASASDCFTNALVSQGGAQLSANAVVVNSGGPGCLLFGDGFESGDTTAWNASVP